MNIYKIFSENPVSLGEFFVYINMKTEKQNTFRLEQTSMEGFVKNPLGKLDWMILERGLEEIEANNLRKSKMSENSRIYIRMVQE